MDIGLLIFVIEEDIWCMFLLLYNFNMEVLCDDD